MAAARSSARGAVIRTALLFSPFLAVTLLGLAFIARDAANEGATGGRIAALIMVGLVALLLGYQVAQSIRDLFSSLVETVGRVERRWSRNEFFLFRNTYIFVEKNVYRLSPEQAIEVQLGNTVRIMHLPHTSSVETIDVVRAEASVQAG